MAKSKVWSKKPVIPLVGVLVQRIRSGASMKQLCREYKVQSGKVATVLGEEGFSYKVLRGDALRSDALLALECIKVRDEI